MNVLTALYPNTNAKVCTDFLKRRCSTKEAVLKNLVIFTEKDPCSSLFFNKIVGLHPCNFMKKRLQHRSFPVNFAKSLRISILKSICERLLLDFLFADPLTTNISHIFPDKAKRLTNFYLKGIFIVKGLTFNYYISDKKLIFDDACENRIWCHKLTRILNRTSWIQDDRMSYFYMLVVDYVFLLSFKTMHLSICRKKFFHADCFSIYFLLS